MKPLDGRTILITRARHQAGSLAAALEREGAKVLAIPAIEMVPPDSYAALDQALADAQKYRWLILTSANGVAVLAERMRTLQKQADTLRDAKIVAIGPATARALEAHGFPVDVMPPEYVAESLVETLRDRVAGQNVLLVRAKVARDAIPVALREAGAVVDVADAYRTVIPASSCAALRQVLAAPNGLPDAVTFTSSSTAANFFLLMKEAGVSAWPPSMAAASIGPITSRTLRDHGLEPAVEATEFTIPGLVAAICRWATVMAK
ncbi:MAG: uroporphyrinogen-III synthase [Acidobacteriaceae bacterium]